MHHRNVDVEQLEGGYRAAPIPPGFTAPPPGLQTIQTLESSNGPWQQAGAYGRKVAVQFPASLDATPESIYSIDGQIGPPRPRTLHLFRSDAQVVPNAGKNAEWYASITYGVGGIQNQFFCDWGRGGQISLVCETLRVEAQAYAPSALAAYAPPDGTQILGGMLSHEGSAPPRPPTFTTQKVLNQFGVTLLQAFPVPDFARWVWPNIVSFSGSFNATDDLLFLSLHGNTLKRVRIDDRLRQLGTPVPGGTTDILYANAGPSDIVWGLQFELGL